MVQSVSVHYLQDNNLQRDAEVVSLSLTRGRENFNMHVDEVTANSGEQMLDQLTM